MYTPVPEVSRLAVTRMGLHFLSKIKHGLGFQPGGKSHKPYSLKDRPVSSFFGSHPHSIVNRADKDFPIPDIAGLVGLYNDFDHLINLVIGNQ
jgi:hypothetical protein